MLCCLHVCGQMIAVATFMRLPTHTAARLVQAALDHVLWLLVPPVVCTAELLPLRLCHAAESCKVSQTMCHLCLDCEHVDLRWGQLRRLACTCMWDMQLHLIAAVAAQQSLVCFSCGVVAVSPPPCVSYQNDSSNNAPFFRRKQRRSSEESSWVLGSVVLPQH